jgi:hypothetical protein
MMNMARYKLWRSGGDVAYRSMSRSDDCTISTATKGMSRCRATNLIRCREVALQMGVLPLKFARLSVRVAARLTR